MHHSIFKVINNPEFFELRSILNHILLDLLQRIIRIVIDLKWNFISIIVEIDEPVVQEEPTIALLAITIINLFSSHDVFSGFYDETFFIVSVRPWCLSWSFMIKHVSVSYKTISLKTLYLNTKDSTRYHHSNFWIFFQRELGIFRYFFADQIVIWLNIFNFLIYLI